MLCALDKMLNSVKNAQEVLQEIKGKTGRRMIGYFHPVIPEELIYAAGLHPVRLFPNTEGSIPHRNSYLQTFLCSELRAVWDEVLRGEHPYLDGVIIPRSCEAVTLSYQTWKRHMPHQYIDYINVPWKWSDNTLDFFATELERVKKNLETFTGKEIPEDSLRSAIRLYNKNRELLRKVYGLRKAETPSISGFEAINVVRSSFLFDKAEHNELLDQLLTELPQKLHGPKRNIRLLISGGCVNDLRLWEMIESVGGSIVADDVNNGSRAFWHSVVEKSETPMRALARGYARVPCAFSTSIMNRFNYISEMITEYQVHGVIFAVNRNCESEKLDYPELDKKIKERFEIPTLNIETDYLMSLGALRNRVEAFIELLS